MSTKGDNDVNGKRPKPPESHADPDIQAIQESEARLRHVFEKAPVSIWLEDFSEIRAWFDQLRAQGVVDFRQYLEEHPEAAVECAARVRIRDVNEQALALHRAPSKEILLGSLAQMFTEQSFDVFREELLSLWSGESGNASEAVLKTLDGELITVLMKIFLDPSRPDWSIAYVAATDITQQKQAEEALRQSEEKFRTIVTNSQPIIFTLDLEGKFLLSEGKMLSALGLAPGEVVGRSAFELYADYPAVIDGIKKAMNGEGSEATIDVGGVHFEIFWSPFRDAHGEVEGVIGMGVDITARVEAERERERLEAQLHQVGKMEAIGNLAGGVAHDFNNLLQAMLGYVELVLDDKNLDSQHRVDLERVRRSAQSASSLTRQLLAFSRRQVIDPVDLDLNDLIIDVSGLVRRLIPENIDLDFIPWESACTVNADRNQIEQVLINLAVNGRDAMSDGGRLVIRTEKRDIDTEYGRDHPGMREGRFVVLSVSDTGYGMDKATRAQMFDPFFTTKALGEGTGLGLASVHGTVHQHDGMIEAFSEVGRGTTMQIYLPFVDRDVVRPARVGRDDSLRGTGTILVAEDEPLIRYLIQQILTKAGYQVVVASNGEEALQKCEELDGHIKLAVLDVVMPELGGYATMERIAERWPNIRFLFSSGYSQEAGSSGYVLKQGTAFLQKPFESVELLQKVRSILAD